MLRSSVVWLDACSEFAAVREEEGRFDDMVGKSNTNSLEGNAFSLQRDGSSPSARRWRERASETIRIELVVAPTNFTIAEMPACDLFSREVRFGHCIGAPFLAAPLVFASGNANPPLRRLAEDGETRSR